VTRTEDAMLAQPVQSPEALGALVDALKGAWRAGATPDAAEALREHPDLLPFRSLVVDLVYEEYCVREEAGDVPETDQFCGQFPVYRSHIREVIRGHRLLADHPDLVKPATVWPRPGDTFEQLTVVRELGRGSFARAYLARDPEAGDRAVVLKLAPSRSAEARTLGTIAHEGIAAVLWARPAGGFFAICMPYVGALTLRDAAEAALRAPGGPSGRALLAAVNDPALPPVAAAARPALTGRESHADAIAAIAGRLADAVAHLHARGIAHGDLKPTNVLLGPGGAPHLIDFNLATGQTDSLLRRGGTLPYMPPEQLRVVLGGRDECPALAGDVYSFGVVLFEALAGRVPFEPCTATEPAAVAADLLCRLTAARRPLTAGANLPAPLARLIDRCLEIDPARRPPIGRVREALERYSARHRRRRTAAAAAAGVLAVAAAWLAVPRAEPPVPEESPIAATQAAFEATPHAADEFFARGLRHLRSGDFGAAVSDFGAANRKAPSGRTSAYLAYAHGLDGFHFQAEAWYRRALGQGYAPAWVHNNLAHDLLQLGSKAQAEQAIDEANAALKLDPNLLPARLNRAMGRHRLSVADPATYPYSPEALADIEAVMRHPVDSAPLCVMAAYITARFGADREECRARAVGYLREAVRLGCPPTSLAKNLAFDALKERPDFRALGSVLAAPPPEPRPRYAAAGRTAIVFAVRDTFPHHFAIDRVNRPRSCRRVSAAGRRFASPPGQTRWYRTPCGPA
jgi:tetratricopeptide (TPR) repeat protein